MGLTIVYWIFLSIVVLGAHQEKESRISSKKCVAMQFIQHVHNLCFELMLYLCAGSFQKGSSTVLAPQRPAL